jgi:hypothetical protein
MLSSLISGARDVRAPLVVGLILATTFWFYFGPNLPTPSEASGFLAFLYHTTSTLGASASITAGIFLAYMFGSLAVRISVWSVDLLDNASRWVASRIYDKYATPDRDMRAVANFVNGWSPIQHPMRYIAGRVRNWKIYQDSTFEEETLFKRIQSLVTERLAFAPPPLLRSLSRHAQSDFIQAFGHGGDVAGLTEDEMREGLVNVYTHQIQREVKGLTTRLRIRNAELYDDYDRLKTEGDLRISVAIPLLLLSAALAARWSPWFALLAFVCPILWLHGRELQDRAGAILGEALTEEVVTTPALDRLDRALGRVR